jgi:hypothetical protein
VNQPYHLIPMSHYLLVYDRTAGRLLRKQEFETSGAAMSARFAAEDEFSGRSEIEIVDLSAASDEELRRTHGRYFLTLDELAARLA